MLKDHKHHYKGGQCMLCGSRSWRGMVAGAAIVLSAVGAACSPPPATLIPPALVHAATWSNMNGPTIYLSGDAASRGKPWCGTYVKVDTGTTGDAFPCDPGVFSHTVNGVTLTSRTRVDVDLSPLFRGKDWDASLAASLLAECDDAGGEMIAHLDGANVVAEVDCEDVDY